MQACSRAGGAMGSRSGTSHLAAWLILFGGCQKWTFGLPHPTSTFLWEWRYGTASLPAGGEPCIPGRCPQRWGGRSLPWQRLEGSAEALPTQAACRRRSLQVSDGVCVTQRGSPLLASRDRDEEWV